MRLLLLEREFWTCSLVDKRASLRLASSVPRSSRPCSMGQLHGPETWSCLVACWYESRMSQDGADSACATKMKFAFVVPILIFLNAATAGDVGWIYKCFPVGVCEKCTELETKSLSYCQATGKREPIECNVEWMGQAPVNASYPPKPSLEDAPEFRPCAALPGQEGKSFFLFFLVNLLILPLSLAVMLVRTRSVYADRIRHVARRFGIPVS